MCTSVALIQHIYTSEHERDAQRQYAQTGRLNPRYLPSILLQAFIALWSGAAVGPEGPLVFLSGGVGSFIADRFKL
ncbi:MAG TPA: hypothetical protein DD730_12610 [Desulfosporosinus sp.]|nr:hypothetical protein [Desulfosporosinus sp.]